MKIQKMFGKASLLRNVTETAAVATVGTENETAKAATTMTFRSRLALPNIF